MMASTRSFSIPDFSVRIIYRASTHGRVRKSQPRMRILTFLGGCVKEFIDEFKTFFG
jgi:hypothetical protein